MAESRATILVIDDEAGIREGCQRALSLGDHEVLLAADGPAGLALLRQHPVNLVLLDIMMPAMDGMAVLERIMAIDPEIVVIIITGYATIELAIQAIKRGAYDFLSKPFDAATLQLAVDQGLERQRLSREAHQLEAKAAEAQRLAEEKAELQKLNSLKSRFTLLVAHELRAPVAAIQSYLKLILEGYVPQDRFMEIIGKAERRADEQLALINDLLDLAKITNPAPQQRQEEWIDLVAVLQETYDQLQAQAAEKRLQVDMLIAPDLPPVRIPPKHSQQLWMNLLSNAIKYTPEGGQVTVELGVENGQIVGHVRDTGIGIPEEDLPRIFEDFFRARNAKDHARMGTGLGLSIVKAVLELCGGSISVESTLGEGSTFTFTLPVASDRGVLT